MTSFYSNVDIEVVQVQKEHEWEQTYSIRCDQLLNASKHLEFRVKSQEVSTIGIGFKIEADADIEDLSAFKFTVQILYPDKTTEASKHNAHGFFSKAWLIKIKPEFVGKDVMIVCKPRDESAQIDFSKIFLIMASE